MLRKGKIMTALLVAASAVSLIACTNESKENLTPDTSGNGCDTTNVTYANYVKGIMDASCATSGCHDAATKSEDIDLSTYAGVKGTAIAMAHNTSLLLGAIKHQSGFDAMPENANKLSDCTISKITAWVNAGTPE